MYWNEAIREREVGPLWGHMLAHTTALPCRSRQVPLICICCATVLLGACPHSEGEDGRQLGACIKAMGSPRFPSAAPLGPWPRASVRRSRWCTLHSWNCWGGYGLDSKDPNPSWSLGNAAVSLQWHLKADSLTCAALLNSLLLPANTLSISSEKFLLKSTQGNFISILCFAQCTIFGVGIFLPSGRPLLCSISHH